jgi:heme o synthase
MHEATIVTAQTSIATTWRACHELTKPGITLFVGLTAAAGYLLVADAAPVPLTLIALVLATMLMSGGAAALNQVAERDLDARMQRTRQRPIVAGLITPEAAQWFAWSLTIAGALLAAIALPPLALLYLAVCHITYVYLYTPLKRSTTLCTLAGAIPGALPVMAGAAAAGGPTHAAAWLLTGLLFAWQIPHFFAIGWLTRDDYARAGFALLPVRDATGLATARSALLYAIATHGFAILLTREAEVAPFAIATIHTAGTLYVVAVLPFLRQRGKIEARRLFFASLVVLPVILIALMANALL